MLIEESKWIRDVLKNDFQDVDFPLLNVGSSDFIFRTEVQPHIHQNIFEPLTERGCKVIHSDIKEDDGVDYVGDLNDPDFRGQFMALGVRGVLCSNLLEHLVDPQLICDSIRDLLESGDKMIITVPHQFPYHKDPIDTMLRPTADELVKMFPETKVLRSEIVEEDRCFWNDLMQDKKFFLIICARWVMPFYKYSDWKHMIKDLFQLRRKYSASCVVLEKN